MYDLKLQREEMNSLLALLEALDYDYLTMMDLTHCRAVYDDLHSKVQHACECMEEEDSTD